MSERYERTSERTIEWPSANVPISRDSESLCDSQNDQRIARRRRSWYLDYYLANRFSDRRFGV